MMLRGIDILHSLVIILLIGILSSCYIESYSTKKISADTEILSYVKNNGYEVVPDSLGLVYIPLRQGNGVSPQSNNLVAFHYVGFSYKKLISCCFRKRFTISSQACSNVLSRVKRFKFVAVMQHSSPCSKRTFNKRPEMFSGRREVMPQEVSSLAVFSLESWKVNLKDKGVFLPLISSRQKGFISFQRENSRSARESCSSSSVVK